MLNDMDEDVEIDLEITKIKVGRFIINCVSFMTDKM